MKGNAGEFPVFGSAGEVYDSFKGLNILEVGDRMKEFVEKGILVRKDEKGGCDVYFEDKRVIIITSFEEGLHISAALFRYEEDGSISESIETITEPAVGYILVTSTEYFETYKMVDVKILDTRDNPPTLLKHHRRKVDVSIPGITVTDFCEIEWPVPREVGSVIEHED